MKSNTALAKLERMIGAWNVTGEHPMLAGRRLRGRVTFERIEDGAFVRMHMKMQDAEIPEGVALFGNDDGDGSYVMLYFDARGVSRHYDVVFEADGLVWSREAAPPQFAQRFRVAIVDDDHMTGGGSMKKAGQAWEPDLSLVYERER